MNITQPDSSGSHLSALDIAQTFSRHTKKAIAIFLLVIMATVCWIVFIPGKYESFAKIYVRIGRENSTLDPSATTGQTINIQQSIESDVNSLLQILESRETAVRVVQSVGAETILADDLAVAGSSAAGNERVSTTRKIKRWISDIKNRWLPAKFSESREARAVRAFREQSKCWAPKISNVIELSSTAGHPELAQQIVRAWTKALVEEHLRVTQTKGSLSFFVHEDEQLKQQLLTVEQDLKDVKSSSQLVSIEGQREILEEQAKLIRARELANDSLLASAQAKVQELSSILKTIPKLAETDQRNSALTQGWYNLRERLFELQIKEHELKSRYSAANPEVIAVMQQREAIEQIFAKQSESISEVKGSPNPTYLLFQESLLQEQAEVVALVAEHKTLQQQKQANLAEIEKLNDSVLVITDLERQRLILETSYLASSARVEQCKILQGLETAKISSLSELQSASYDARPIGLGKMKKLLIGAFLGIIVASGFVGIAEYFNRSFVTASQVELALNLPVLVTIPQNRRQPLEVS